ncbi:Serine/threonine-protein phosphatase 6 regulatory ankyrin repeat subunit B [Ceratocystis platani]|uniref:Serine/threonine-protein phosphatase 6 regulatory ankyrin repeat subunit B n=1 Tax=Ceratocystis fimbriata f. sp. platani TaxID=88771 RepID=A0A0F8BJF8_CERFI|nr:Serine/threonine-protein phosphatase 6 regulatory ankyrin repeat subunit B [Ceratocystis platani]
MDPLSFTASIIAVVGLAGSVVKGLNDLAGAFRDAPGEILALNNEVADLQAILSDASQFARPRSSCPPDISPSFSSLIGHLASVQENLSQLEDLLDKCVTNGSKLTIQTRWVRKRHRAKTIQTALRSARENLHLSLALVTFSRVTATRGSHDLNSPLKLILGALFIGYTGLPVFTPSCNEQSCEHRSTLAFDIIYYFPIWFLARALCVSIKFSPSAGPEMTLKTPRLIRWVHKEAQLFHLAQAGDIPGIQKMFTTGMVSPTDMTAAQGETALHQHAASFAQFETCKFLLEAGADATAVNMNQVSIDIAWQWILSGRLDPKTIEFVQGLFVGGEFVKSRQFSVIHKVVLGLFPDKNLAVELDASTSGINAADIGGKTSLAWAAFRADQKSLQLLLDYGADMNKADKSGNHPLHYAALARDSCCIQPLLDAGAVVDPCNIHLQTPLHSTSKEHDDPSFIEPLLRAGADIDRGDCEGETPLMYATRSGKLRSAETLLANGANINARTIWGITALDLCVLYGTPTMLEFLLQAGADVSSNDIYGRTILHQAASHGSVNMVRTLLDHGLQDVDPDAVDVDGISMWNIVETKGQPEFTELFEHDHFRTWLKQESSPLLVSVDPGCGKSVLAKYLIDYGLPRSTTICYFFFKDQDQNTVIQAICALLHQLFSQKPSLIEHAMPQFRKDGQGLVNSTESLWKVLRNAIKDPQTGPVIMVLDALDECAELEFADLMRNVESQSCGDHLGHSKLKYLLTCRPYDQIVSKFRSL